MSVTIKSIKTTYPQFRDIPEPIILEELNFAFTYCPSEKWKNHQTRDIAVSLLTAHLLTRRQEQLMKEASNSMAIAQGSPISSTITPSSSAHIEDTLTTTKYGEKFLLLKKSITPMKTGLLF